MTRALQTVWGFYSYGKELAEQGEFTKAEHCFRQAISVLECHIEMFRTELAKLDGKEE